ncbi:dicarboxylate/amino acid:cation symporter [Ectothiorhodospiraceae bacterium 2226]|nr:dicarboxylate/amino acid:cation symporter [Ectothiorhodospiraceae bacterium 2226]
MLGNRRAQRGRVKLHWQILIGLALAVPAGLLAGTDAGLFGVTFHQAFDFVGTLFLNALLMLVVPLVLASIINAMAGIGSSGALGRLGGKTLLYYLATSLFAILVGLMLVNLIEPGTLDGRPAGEVMGLQAEVDSPVVAQLEGRGAGEVAEIFLRMIPTNVVDAAAQGQLLGLIFFSLLFGFFMTRIDSPYRETLTNFWQAVFDVMMRMTDLVLRFAPLGVFALVARVMAETGLAAFGPLALFFVTVVLALAIHFLITLPLVMYFVGRVNPWRQYRAMAPALLTAFSTSSSAATLPLTLECVQKNAGVSQRTSGFVLPLGATVNMDGTALYECVAVLFIAQAYGLDLSLGTQLLVVVIALVTSIGVAGIPAAGLVAIAIILAAVGLPLEGIALILAVDRLLDMFRTAVNVFGDSCGAVVIARREGEEGILQNGSDAASGSRQV